MIIYSMEYNTACECGGCKKVISVLGEGGEALDALRDKHDRHLRRFPLCRKWYDDLPSFEDIRNALRSDISLRVVSRGPSEEK